LSYVNLTIRNSNELNKILGFAISKPDGSYSIKITQTITDTLILSVSKLGFTTIEKKVLAVNQTLDFTIRKGETELKEIVVKPPPVRRKGDTLTYKVDEFKSYADRSIGDVIKKLPGVEMDQYGQILYQGKAINRYYIEGMNLLGGRYGLANDNLPHGKVATVEILENHQPIRLLDSLSFSDRAAINIKLKSKVTKTGVLHYGLGAKPFIWDINATPMVFVPGWQFLGSIQSNTIGKNTLSTFKDFFQSEYATNQTWLEIPKLSTPPFSEKRYLDNVSHAGSVNTLKKNRKDLELKLNSSIVLDKFRQTGDEQVTYFLGNETFGYTESTHNVFHTNQASITLNLEKNTQKNYFKNDITIENEWRADGSTNKRLDKSYDQDNKTENFRFSNSLHKIFRVKNNQYNFYSTAGFIQNTQRLSVKLLEADSTANPTQYLYHKGFNANNYFDFTSRISKKITLATRVGSDISLTNFETELTQHDLNTDAANDFNWNNFKIYVSETANFRHKKWQISLEFPFSYYIIQYKPYKTKRSFQKMVVEPKLNFRYKNNQNTEFYLSGMHNNFLSKPGDIYGGFVMTNYLNLTRKNADFADNHNYNTRGGINYNNVISGFSFNVSYGLNYIIQNQIAQNNINTDGSNEVQYTARNNSFKTNSGYFTVRKYIFPLKTSFSAGLNLSFDESDIFVNGNFLQYKMQTVSPYAGLSVNGLKWLEFNYQTKLRYSNNHSTFQKITNYSHSLSSSFNSIKNTLLQISLEYNSIKTTQSSNRNYLFGDVLIRYTLPKIKQDFEISLTNIFNRGSFENVYLNNYYIQLTNFQLRPRQLIIRGRISF
jgi:hypothetical protein